MLSQYIDNLIKNIPKRKTPYELDVVLEGGVFNGSYELGILIFLKALEKKNYLKINRLSGTSIGAVAAFKYLTDNLDTSMQNYERFRNHIRTHFNLNILKQIIDDDIAAMSPEVFERIKNDILYINYFDVEKKEQILESRYTSKKHLRDTILKSCHLPFLSDGSCCVQENGRLLLDGGLPYIFPERERRLNKRILYISISGASKIKTMFNTKNEKTIHGRFLEGVLDVYNFLLKEKKTAMCSFVDTWALQEFMLLRFKHGIITIAVYIIYWLIVVGRFILPLAEKSELYHKMLPIWRDACRDGFLFFCF
jgi:hypothetical protein